MDMTTIWLATTAGVAAVVGILFTYGKQTWDLVGWFVAPQWQMKAAKLEGKTTSSSGR